MTFYKQACIRCGSLTERDSALCPKCGSRSPFADRCFSFSGLSGLSGLMKGFCSFMPQDDPITKIFNASNELIELQQRELQLYADVGRKILSDISGRPEFAGILNELQENQRRQAQVKESLRLAQEEKDEKERQEEEMRAALTCPNCSTVNPEGVKFCQECGSKLV